MASKHYSIREKSQTHSLEVDYSIFMMVAMLMMSKRLEKRPGATTIAFPLPIFAGIASISLFHVSTLRPRGNTLGGLYIVIFRSSWSIWDEDGWHRRFKDQMRLGGVAWLGARTSCACLGLMASLIDFLCSRRFSWSNINTQKILGDACKIHAWTC
jgi:hypothetical protein